MTNVLYNAEGILRVNKRMNIERGPNVNRKLVNFGGETFIVIVINEQFKSKFRLTKDNFNIIRNRIEASIVKTPINLVPEPIELNRQLGLTIYKLAHDGTFTVIGDVFRFPCNSNF